MSWITVTIEWALLYTVVLYVAVGLGQAALGIDSNWTRWFAITFSAVWLIGLGLVIRQGATGHLPGIGGSSRGLLPFIGRLVAWSGGLGLLAGSVVAMVAYRVVSKAWARGEGASGLIIVYPAGVACLIGAAVGGVIAIVKTFL